MSEPTSQKSDSSDYDNAVLSLLRRMKTIAAAQGVSLADVLQAAHIVELRRTARAHRNAMKEFETAIKASRMGRVFGK